MAEPRVAILGAGPAGLGGAYRLRTLGRASVVVLEQQGVPGGNAGSFDFAGLTVDYGSHRLHPACEPAILADIRRFLGGDLLDRPRHGRIRLRGRWIHFPLAPLDLLLRLDPSFAVRALRDAVLKPFRGAPREDSFAAVLEANLGPAICDDFYFPYARKIWGRDPEELSGIQARRRVSAGSFAKLVRKVLNQVPGFKRPGAGRFFYPRQGFGQISRAFGNAAAAAGAELRYGWRVTRLTPPSNGNGRWVIDGERGGVPDRIEAEWVWSTIPITLLTKAIPGAPDPVIRAAGQIEYRGMALIYLDLPVGQFTEFDAHYFPGADTRITRLSEPKNYSARTEPAATTVLCAELPCSPGDELWSKSDEELGVLVGQDLARSGIPLPAPPRGVMVRRLKQAYPIYTRGYQEPFALMDQWVETVPNLLTYGRQGLFAHDNTHHALAMAYAAADCLEPAGFNHARWADYRKIFETHVVED